MVWKQDLVKIKQQLGPEAPVPKAPPKPTPKPDRPASLDEEDAVFLSAMGQKASPSRQAKPKAAQNPPEGQPAVESPTPETFVEALKDLKGLKPLARGISGRPSPSKNAPREMVPPPRSYQPPLLIPDAPMALPLESPEAPKPHHPRSVPQRFQLAAGMALEVDGGLDLRGHSLSDAMDRLRDRLGDGMVLGWRCLQVTLGADMALHEGLLNLLASGEAPMVARYAQAPVPMGGTQAWLLYFTPTSVQS